MADSIINQLMCAAQNKNIKLVKILLDGGIPVNAVDHNGRSALMHACRLESVGSNSKLLTNKTIDLIHLLLRNGGDVNITDYLHRTCLMYAYMNNVPPLAIKLMLKSGASTTICDVDGNTADNFRILSNNAGRSISICMPFSATKEQSRPATYTGMPKISTTFPNNTHRRLSGESKQYINTSLSRKVKSLGSVSEGKETESMYVLLPELTSTNKNYKMSYLTARTSRRATYSSGDIKPLVLPNIHESTDSKKGANTSDKDQHVTQGKISECPISDKEVEHCYRKKSSKNFMNRLKTLFAK